MKIQIYNRNTGMAMPLWETSLVVGGIDKFNDQELFFEIPQEILTNVRSNKQKITQSYMLNRLRFLITYDFNLFLSANSEVLVDIPIFNCDDVCFEKLLAQCKKNIEYAKNDTERHLAEHRLELFERTNFRKIHINSLHKDILAKQIGEEQMKFCAECQLQYTPYQYLFSKELPQSVKIEHEELIFACHIKPWADVIKSSSIIRPTIDDDKFLLRVARALFVTGGKFRSNLYTLLYLMGAVHAKKQNSRNLTKAMLAFERQDNSEGIHTIQVNDNFEIKFSTSCAATILGRRTQISQDAVKKVRDFITSEYEAFIQNDENELRRAVEFDCKIYNNGTPPTTKEHWKNYFSQLKEKWSNDLKNAPCGDWFKPLLCYYYVILQNENDEPFSESFIKDVIMLGTCNNSSLALVPDFFELIYRFGLINERMTASPSKLESKSDKFAPAELDKEEQKIMESTCNEIHNMLEGVVKDGYINPTAIKPAESVYELVEMIVKDTFFAKQIIIPTLKFKFNINLFLNIIGVLYLSKEINDPIFKPGNKKAKGLVRSMGHCLDENNAPRYINGYKNKETSSDGHILSQLNEKLIKRIERIVNDFIGNCS